MDITNWFTGVVEDVNDPQQMGRVRVRCMGYHSDNKTDIPTEHLPWATCIMPVTSSGVSGIGSSPTGLIPGSWVVGFFRDAKECQDPIIMGSVSSSTGVSAVATQQNQSFSDPYNVSRTGNDIPASATSGGIANSESYMNRLNARNRTFATGVASGGPLETLEDAAKPIIISSGAPYIAAARGEIGVVETSPNRGAGIQKYWSATSIPSGYGGPYCAAFVSWCIKQSGVIEESRRPKIAKAFDYEATDFLQKPLSKERFIKAIKKASDLHALRYDLHEEQGESIVIKSNLKKLKIYVSKIKWIEAYGDYIKVVTDDETHLVLSTMKGFEKELPEGKFIRVHKSYIINLARVEKFNNKFAEIGTTKIPLSRNKKEEIIKAIESI